MLPLSEFQSIFRVPLEIFQSLAFVVSMVSAAGVALALSLTSCRKGSALSVMARAAS